MVDRRFRRLTTVAGGLVAVIALVMFAVPAAQASHHKHHKSCARHHKHHRGCVKPAANPGVTQPAPSIFGIDTSTYDQSQADFHNDFAASRSLGARWDRFTAGPATGTGSFKVLDYEVGQARKQGMGVVISFAGIASACSLSPQPASVGACPPTTAADLSNYQGYLKTVLLRYRNVVNYYESWTEPNTSSSWKPAPNPAQYAALLKAQYAVFQSVNQQYGTHLKLLFGSPAGFSTTTSDAVLPFTDQVLSDLGGARAFDGAALHAYRFGAQLYGPDQLAPDYVGSLSFPAQACIPVAGICFMTWTQELSTYEQEFVNHGYGTTPLWLTEFGWPGNAIPSDSYHPSIEGQGSDIQQAYNDLLSLPFVQGALWFNLRDYQPGLVTPDPEFFYHFGLLNFNYSQKPAAASFHQLATNNPNR